MPISALVITLDPDPERRARALDSLHRDPRLTLGEMTAGRLPVVAETETLAGGDRLVSDELSAVEGVVLVDVVLVDFSDVDDFGEGPSRVRGRRQNGDAVVKGAPR